MKRALEWISLGAAAAAIGAHLFPESSGATLTLAGLSFLAAGLDLFLSPKPLLPLLGLLPMLALTAFVWLRTSAGPAALAGLVLAFQARLFFLRSAESAHSLCRSFARDIRSSIPEKAVVFVDMDIEGETPVSSIQEGHLIRIQPGDWIPVDGQVTFGSSFVDESPLTGEMEPKAKSMGSFVFGGSRNKNGSFLFRASGPASSAAAHKLAAALERGFAAPPLASGRILALIALPLLAALALYAFTGSPVAALNALFLSTAAAFAGGLLTLDSSFLARSAAEGLAWKDRESVAQAAHSDMVAARASGVITEGRLRLSGIQGSAQLGEDGALRLIGPLARRLETDAAFSVLQEMQARNIRLEPIEMYLPASGGASGIVDGEEVRWIDLESARLEGLSTAEFSEFAEEHLLTGQPVFLLFRGDKAAAAFAVWDAVSPTAAEGLAELKSLGIPFLLLTPDSPLALRPYQQALQILHAHADCDMEAALLVLEKLKKEGLRPLWVPAAHWKGDNPAGLTVETSQPGAEPSAGLFSLRSDLSALPRILKLARAYERGRKLNFVLAALLPFLFFPVCARMDPLGGAFAGALIGLALLFLARRPLYRSL